MKKFLYRALLLCTAFALCMTAAASGEQLFSLEDVGKDGFSTISNGNAQIPAPTAAPAAEPTAAPVFEVTPVTQHGKKALTMMVYLCGSDLEANHGSASIDLFEMVNSGFNQEQVNVVVLTGGSAEWSIPNIPADKKSIWEVRPDLFGEAVHAANKSSYTREEIFALVREGIVPVSAEPTTNMGDPATLTEFLNFSHTYYPADRYALVLWDHGSGPNSGVCADRLFDSDMLSISELTSSLEASPFGTEKLEWIGFDACLMATVEVAAQMVPYASYMIASEESEPGSGWNYDFLAGIENDADGAATGRRVVDCYTDELVEAYSNAGVELNITLSCVDLSRMGAVQAAGETLFSELEDLLTADTYADFARGRESGAFFGHSDGGRNSYDFDMLDLGSYVEHLNQGSESSRAAFLDALRNAVTYSRTTINNATGLSVYYPYFSSRYFPYFVEKYNPICFAPSYAEFIRKAYDLQTGVAQANWSGASSGIPHLGQKDIRTILTMDLTDEQKNFLAETHMKVFEKAAEGSGLALVSDVPEVSLEGNTLSSEYVHRALFVTDGEGQAVTAALPYTVLGSGLYSVETELVAHSEAGEEFFRQKALLHLKMEDKDGNVTVAGVLGWDDAAGAYVQRYDLPLADFDTWEFVRELREPVEFSEGTLLSWDDWTTVSREVLTCRPAEQKLMFLHNQLPWDTLEAGFAVRDYQNNRYLSSLTPLDNPAPEAGVWTLRYDDSDTLTLSAPQFTVRENGADSTGVFTMDVKNISAAEIIVLLENLQFDGQDTGLTAAVYGFGENDGLMPEEAQRLMLPVPSTALSGHDTITSITFDLVAADPVSEAEIKRIQVTATGSQDLSFMK